SICQQTIHPIPFPDPLLHLKRPRQPSTTLFPYTTLFRSYSPRRTPEGAAAAPGMMEKKDEKKREDIRVIDRRMFTSDGQRRDPEDRKSTRLNSSHVSISYAVFCLKKKKSNINTKIPITKN